MSKFFQTNAPEIQDYWRGIILFGRNVASYKFALAKSLLELRPESGHSLKLDDIAPIYAKHISEHMRLSKTQGTFKNGKFLQACESFNRGILGVEQLSEVTVRLGFNNVIDAFHVVGQAEVGKRFYLDDRKKSNSIIITDEFSQLLSSFQYQNLQSEVESRWRLVETAWDLGISRNLLRIEPDIESGALFAIDKTMRRKAVTSSRDALNGYQKGKCFYCFTDISINSVDADMPDVDHFFPHILKKLTHELNIDGVWNLVLSCQGCNRGVGGKFEKVPSIRLLERLHRRNEFLIQSHHPLRETLMIQTGKNEQQRIKTLNDTHSKALTALFHTFEPEEKAAPSF